MTQVDSRVHEALKHIPDLDLQNYEIEPLSGGITNHNYCVTSNGKRWVVRTAGSGSDILGIRRDWELESAKINARGKISPRILYGSPETGVMISDFVEGKTLEAADVKEPNVLRLAVQLIRKVHQGPEFPGSFSCFETVRRYHELAKTHGAKLPFLKLPLETLGRIESVCEGDFRSVPCHNDLLPANFIQNGEKLWLLDWEYAGMGSLFFDLGNFAVNHELSDKQCELLLRVYFAEVSEKNFAHLKLMALASDMREAFWGLLQSSVSQLDFDYLEYAHKHLTRFIHGTNTAEFEKWLRAMGESK